MKENKEIKKELVSREFEERQKLLSLDRENMQIKHDFKMKELARELENNKRFHEMELERLRIKSAEIKRTMERKENMGFMKNYARNLPPNDQVQVEEKK